MSVQELFPLALELREALSSGAFARPCRVEMSDGMIIDPERMARIVLVDIERGVRDGHGGWLTEDDEHALYDDLRRLLALARVPSTRGASERPAEEQGQCRRRGRVDAACRPPSDSAARRS
jgi:hypothetical protein